jgi:hypothetical protein
VPCLRIEPVVFQFMQPNGAAMSRDTISTVLFLLASEGARASFEELIHLGTDTFEAGYLLVRFRPHKPAGVSGE